MHRSKWGLFVLVANVDLMQCVDSIQSHVVISLVARVRELEQQLALCESDAYGPSRAKIEASTSRRLLQTGATSCNATLRSSECGNATCPDDSPFFSPIVKECRAPMEWKSGDICCALQNSTKFAPVDPVRNLTICVDPAMLNSAAFFLDPTTNEKTSCGVANAICTLNGTWQTFCGQQLPSMAFFAKSLCCSGDAKPASPPEVVDTTPGVHGIIGARGPSFAALSTAVVHSSKSGRQFAEWA